MPRGITFDRYEVPRGGLPGAPGWKIPSMDDGTTEGLSKLSTAAHHVEDALDRAAKLKEATKVGEAYLTASEEMDKQYQAIENSDAREKATEVWGKWYETASQKWGKDLTPEGQAALNEKLISHRAEYGHKTRMLEYKDIDERASRTIIGFSQKYVEAFSRGEATKEWDDLKEAYSVAIGTGARRKDVAEKELLGIREDGAKARAEKMINSANPETHDALLGLFVQEHTKPKSTFLSFIPPEKREAVLKELGVARRQYEADLTKKREEQERVAKIETSTFFEKVAAESDPTFQGQKMSDADFEGGMKAAAQVNTSFDTMRAVRASRSRPAIEGGTSKPGAVEDWKSKILMRDSTATVAAIYNDMGHGRSLSGKDGNELLAMLHREQKETGVSGTEEFKQGRDQIQILLTGTNPNAVFLGELGGVLNENQRRQYAAALSKYYDTARDIFEGKDKLGRSMKDLKAIAIDIVGGYKTTEPNKPSASGSSGLPQGGPAPTRRGSASKQN